MENEHTRSGHVEILGFDEIINKIQELRKKKDSARTVLSSYLNSFKEKHSEKWKLANANVICKYSSDARKCAKLSAIIANILRIEIL